MKQISPCMFCRTNDFVSVIETKFVDKSLWITKCLSEGNEYCKERQTNEWFDSEEETIENWNKKITGMFICVEGGAE